MNDRDYDVAILGAGPGGLFCAYELTRRSRLRVALIDGGAAYAERQCPLLRSGRCAGCQPCQLLSGVGGAAFLYSGKLSQYPAGSGLRRVTDEDCLARAYQDAASIYHAFGVPDSGSDQMQSLPVPEGIQYKYYHSHVVYHKDMAQFASSFCGGLMKQGDWFLRTWVRQVEPCSGGFTIRMEGKDGMSWTIQAKRVVCAVGEAGAWWLRSLEDQLGVAAEASTVDIGVRVEFPHKVMERAWSGHKDLKLIWQAPDGSELRTYCALKHGRCVICNHDVFPIVDALAEDDASTPGSITLFNRIQLPGVDMIAYARRLLEELRRQYGAHILSQRLGKGKSIFPPTLADTRPVDLDAVIPPEVRDNLRFGLERLSESLPGLLSPGHMLYYPAMDKLWRPCRLSPGMETSVKGLYMIGDASGVARGIMQASVTGLLCAWDILDREARITKE